ncbi:MAG: hypothetical protein N3A66_07535, partial [Planctomycetota bacterium]|nr:hypothetical protein [Planctomycetota bacterium]
MKRLPKITIGVSGVAFAPFYAFRQEEYQQRVKALTACAQTWGARIFATPQPFTTAEEAHSAAAYLRRAKPSLVILDICTFPQGKAMEVFFDAVTAPLALWSRPEMKKRGPIGHNSFCGANFAGANLALRGRRFRTLFGDVKDAEFQGRMRTAIRLLQAAEAARGSAIGLIGGGIVPKFFDLDMSEAERASLAARWDVRFVPIPFEAWFEAAAQVPAAKAKAEAARQAKCYR